jgi:hypothetical protein
MAFSIIIGSLIIKSAIRYKKDEISEIGIYQITRVDDKNVVIIDTRTGQYWRKPIKDNSSVKEGKQDTIFDEYI